MEVGVKSPLSCRDLCAITLSELEMILGIYNAVPWLCYQDMGQPSTIKFTSIGSKCQRTQKQCLRLILLCITNQINAAWVTFCHPSFPIHKWNEIILLKNEISRKLNRGFWEMNVDELKLGKKWSPKIHLKETSYHTHRCRGSKSGT